MLYVVHESRPLEYKGSTMKSNSRKRTCSRVPIVDSDDRSATNFLKLGYMQSGLLRRAILLACGPFAVTRAAASLNSFFKTVPRSR
jgi:hypothetical protein